jgi:membrane-associated PAP2 superfamily phosphatase
MNERVIDHAWFEFWRVHAVLPALSFLAAFMIIAASDLDVQIADALFFDWSDNAWIGAHTWWAYDLIHTGGSWFVRAVGLAALVTLGLSYWRPRWRGLCRGAAYLVLGLILVPSVVGTLKQVTNVDCPWDLDRYGGDRPYVSLLADRPDELPSAHCYPGSHASSGFALMAFYFVLHGRRPRLARWTLFTAILLGTIFSFGQQARGAHFLSHDLASAAIAWFLLLGLWRWLLATAPETVQPQVVQRNQEWEQIRENADRIVLAEREVEKQQQTPGDAHVPEHRRHGRAPAPGRRVNLHEPAARKQRNAEETHELPAGDRHPEDFGHSATP